MGINETLTEAGEGLGSFLNSIQSPLVSFLIGLAVAGGIGAFFIGLFVAMKKSMGGATGTIGR